MTDDREPIYPDDVVWRGLEIAEQHIPLDDLKLALERDLWLSRFILHRLAQVYSVPRELACQLHMLRHVIAEERNCL
jgi:hypothetical protein